MVQVFFPAWKFSGWSTKEAPLPLCSVLSYPCQQEQDTLSNWSPTLPRIALSTSSHSCSQSYIPQTQIWPWPSYAPDLSLLLQGKVPILDLEGQSSPLLLPTPNLPSVVLVAQLAYVWIHHITSLALTCGPTVVKWEAKGRPLKSGSQNGLSVPREPGFGLPSERRALQFLSLALSLEAALLLFHLSGF